MSRFVIIGLTLAVWLGIGLVVAVFFVAPAFESESGDPPITIKTLVPIAPAPTP